MRANDFVDRAGGTQDVGRTRDCRSQQRGDVPDRPAYAAVCVYSRKPVLYCRLRCELALVDENSGFKRQRMRVRTTRAEAGILSELRDGGALLRLGGHVPAVPVLEEDFGVALVELDPSAGTNLPSFREVADVRFVVSPDHEVEDLVRPGLIDIDERGRAVA